MVCGVCVFHPVACRVQRVGVAESGERSGREVAEGFGGGAHLRPHG